MSSHITIVPEKQRNLNCHNLNHIVFRHRIPDIKVPKNHYVTPKLDNELELLMELEEVRKLKSRMIFNAPPWRVLSPAAATQGALDNLVRNAIDFRQVYR